MHNEAKSRLVTETAASDLRQEKDRLSSEVKEA